MRQNETYHISMNQKQDMKNKNKPQKKEKVEVNIPCNKEAEKAYLKNVAERVNEVLAFYKIGARASGRATGIHYSKIARIMEGMAVVDIIFLKNFCEAYNVSLDWLILGKGWMFVWQKETQDKNFEIENNKLKIEVQELKETITSFNKMLNKKKNT